MGNLIINRPKEFSSYFRKYSIHINDVDVAKIGNGQTLELNIPDGINSIQVTIDWCYSEIIMFESLPSSTVNFECGSKLRGWDLFKASKLLTIPDAWVYLKIIE